MNEREKDFAERFNDNVEGFVYSRGYFHSDKSMWVKCKVCGNEEERTGGFLRKVIRKERNLVCKKCEKKTKEYDVNVAQLRESILEHAIKPTSCLKQVKVFRCKQCDKYFITNKRNPRYCSDKCLNRNKNKRKEVKKRIRSERMKTNGIFDSTISLEKLYRKAKGKCYICNCQCCYNDYKVVSNSFIVGETYPTIEHVMPLSKGGSHSWDNVKLACWKCNTLKSDKEVACGM